MCLILSITSVAQRGANSITESRKFNVEIHMSEEILLLLHISTSCAAVFEGLVCCKSIQQCYRQKSTPLKLLWGEQRMTWLGVWADTHPADRPASSSFTATHHTDAVCCFCLSTQHSLWFIFGTSVQHRAEVMLCLSTTCSDSKVASFHVTCASVVPQKY